MNELVEILSFFKPGKRLFQRLLICIVCPWVMMKAIVPSCPFLRLMLSFHQERLVGTIIRSAIQAFPPLIERKF